MKTVELGGGRQATYEVVGRGLPTLMFAGGPGFAGSYMRGTAELFADELQSHLIDPHGSGGSTPPQDPAEYSPEGHARFYEGVRAALGLGSVTVFGHSFGASTALTYSAMYPDQMDRCIAVAAAGVGPEQDEAEGGEAAAEMDELLMRHEGAPWFPEAKDVWDSWTERVLATDDPAEVDRMMAAVLPLYTAHPDRPDVAEALQRFADDMKSDLAATKAWESGLYQSLDIRPFLGRIHAPTLVVAGELDLICGPAQASPIADAVANATLVVIPDCGHMPMVETPDLFRERVVAWLESPR
jgi:pimeloyl-ACP methyl ester carboxylesterase